MNLTKEQKDMVMNAVKESLQLYQPDKKELNLKVINRVNSLIQNEPYQISECLYCQGTGKDLNPNPQRTVVRKIDWWNDEDDTPAGYKSYDNDSDKYDSRYDDEPTTYY